MCLLYTKEDKKPVLIISSTLNTFNKKFTFDNVVEKLNDSSIPNFKIIKIIESYIDSGKLVSDGFNFSFKK